jgi:hypothetical protein
MRQQQVVRKPDLASVSAACSSHVEGKVKGHIWSYTHAAAYAEPTATVFSSRFMQERHT